MTEILYALSSVILGIFAGTQIVESALFVPYWKSLSATEFFRHHKTYGPKIYRFFAPITILATFIPMVSASYSFINGSTGYSFSLIAAIASILFFSTYYLYFKDANESFAQGKLNEEELRLALIKWGKWHWARVYIELVALLFSIIALVKI